MNADDILLILVIVWLALVSLRLWSLTTWIHLPLRPWFGTYFDETGKHTDYAMEIGPGRDAESHWWGFRRRALRDTGSTGVLVPDQDSTDV